MPRAGIDLGSPTEQGMTGKPKQDQGQAIQRALAIPLHDVDDEEDGHGDKQHRRGGIGQRAIRAVAIGLAAPQNRHAGRGQRKPNSRRQRSCRSAGRHSVPKPSAPPTTAPRATAPARRPPRIELRCTPPKQTIARHRVKHARPAQDHAVDAAKGRHQDGRRD